MDFIETMFGFSPDGGSGAFEMLLFLIPVVGIYIIYRLRSNSKKSKAVDPSP